MQIPLVENSKQYSAFTVGANKYPFTRLFFGLKTAAPNFQKIINEVLGDFIGNGALAYLDDVVIYGKDKLEHDVNIFKVLERLREFKLRVKPSKCQFLTNQIEFLGHRITPSGVKMTVEKINALKKLAIPTTIRRLRSFLGMTNYYRRFVKDFGIIAAPLYKLLKKGTKFVWNKDCQIAFDSLIKVLMIMRCWLFRASISDFISPQTPP